MGWTSYHVKPIYNNGKLFIDRKTECDRTFRCDAIHGETNKVVGKYELLKSAMVGGTHYAAVKKTIFATETEPERTIVFAAITLTRVDNKNYFNFAYKDMEESMGPCERNCPKSILDLLTPTDSEYAKEWRKDCYENLKKKRDPNTLANLPIGSVIKYTHRNGMEIELFKHSAAYQFKRPFWMMCNDNKYVPTNHIPSNYVIVKRGNNDV